MFVRSAAAAALDRKKELFSLYDHDRREEQRRVQGWLEELKAISHASLNRKLDAIDDAWPGALPTAEFDRADGMRIPMGVTWRNREQARHWALETLDGRPALAVDGSQIVPTTDYSPPVGAVQIGWFFNDRCRATDGDAAGRYEKEIAFEVLAPDELLDSGGDDGVFPNWRVNQERFILECAKLCEFMERCAERPFERRPVCFFDGSLIISFAGQLRAGREHGYIQAVQELLACSERTRTPLVGYVDNTYSRDLVTLLAALHGLPAPAQINDAYLLRETLSSWGDRSPFWICARPDRLSDAGRADFYKQVCFCLARVGMENPPARLEMPLWLLESGRADEIVALVLAEAVVGSGYPYVLEAADVTAVIQQQDRQRFYRLYQDFLQAQGMAMTITRKQRSKQLRR
ncbi:MAG: DNA double-strand break repair nuclease NurA [Caldilineaceae bacterium SB0661_bin_32]|uniref:DNA double-strand break repair nuclease NurA n=1 Tax=Caldilineaceae bacterium SB0661_bin_32 TaxID=2605255 RepID=A0A6B1D2B9_9CHLR|nr:DNA double-strand break repair nuclease NurA [Caldilineaceae bacterium SB0661_bin_32]